MKRTTLAELLVIIAVLALATYLLLRAFYDSIPTLSYSIALPIGGLAIAELIAARRVHLAVTHDPDAKPMAAIVIARCVALGKASALVAAAMVGAMVGWVAKVLPDAGQGKAQSNDLRVGLIILGTSLLLLVAGYLLERSGLIPRNPGNEPVHL
jgi:hypothetical protein